MGKLLTKAVGKVLTKQVGKVLDIYRLFLLWVIYICAEFPGHNLDNHCWAFNLLCRYSLVDHPLYRNCCNLAILVYF